MTGGGVEAWGESGAAGPSPGLDRYHRRLELCRAYRALFSVEPGAPNAAEAALVLADLDGFCRFSGRLDARTESGAVDPLSLCINEGRRHVRLHITERLREPRPPASGGDLHDATEGTRDEHDGLNAAAGW